MKQEHLTLELLAPYLPYKLKVRVFDEKEVVMIASGSSSSNWVGIGAVIKWSENCKPLFHPLSRLTEEMNLGGKSIFPINNWQYTTISIEIDDVLMGLALGDKDFSYRDLPYYVVVQLIAWHFDVFGLIDKGLAEAIEI